MGSPAGETGAYPDEVPQRSVGIHSFAAGKYEVTFDEWDACVADGGCGGYRPKDESWGRGRRPVINVSWNDAQKYVAWLKQKTGKPYRLLTEAEREYATRAGTTSAYYTGASISTNQANFNSALGKTKGVGSYSPNPWGSLRYDWQRLGMGRGLLQ
jgi:formylglycine-generating enzyme required for sulfatase activity